MKNPLHRSSVFGMTLLALCAFLAPVAKAQFAGPALGASPSANIAQQTTTDPALLNPAQTDLVVVPGDVLVIRLFGVPDFSPPVRVSADGNIQLPLIGIVPVGGLTIARSENLIAQRLIDAGMYRNPQVSLQVTEAASQFVTLSGEMHGVIPIAGERRLLDVISAAGGLPITASHVITIQRPGVEKAIVLDLGTDPSRSANANVTVLPRDTIIISRVGVVYMLGAFKTQTAIPLQQAAPLTLLEATAIAGGANFEGKHNDLRIIRTTGLERKLLVVDLRGIQRGKAPDPLLQADDIVFLPTDALKGALKNGGIGTITSIASLLIIALQRQ